MQRNRKTGIRFNLIPQDCTIQDVRNFMKAQRKLTNYASTKLLELMQDDESICKEILSLNGGTLMGVSQRILVDKTDFRQYRESLGFSLSINERIATSVAARFYLGYAKRNGVMKNGKWINALPEKPAITRQNKAIHLIDGAFKIFVNGEITIINERKNGLVDLSNISFQLRGLDGVRHNFSASIPKKQFKLLKFLNIRDTNNCCCNMFFVGDVLTIVVLIDEKYELTYDHQTVLGIDFNRRSDVFITMSDGAIIKRPQSISDLVKEISDLDSAIGKAENSKKRSPFRRCWQTKRKQLRKELMQIAQQIIDKTISQKALLCVDGVTMAQTGTFGHAELKESILKLCRQHKIPFVIVPSAHTSSDCAICGEDGIYHPVGRSANMEIVSCDRCKKNYHADINAAKNIALDGKKIFDRTDADLVKVKSDRPTSKQRKKPVFTNYEHF